jgi:hypothetical protein
VTDPDNFSVSRVPRSTALLLRAGIYLREERRRSLFPFRRTRRIESASDVARTVRLIDVKKFVAAN